MTQDSVQQPEPLPHDGGFEDETAQPKPPVEPVKKPAKTGKSAAELKANFLSVFGSGLGKFALIAGVGVVVLFVALGVRGLSNTPTENKAAKVDVPQPPPAKVTIDPIDEKEAIRRSTQAAIEADAAARKGQTYQPDFNPAVVANKQNTGGGIAQPELPFGNQPNNGQPPVPPNANKVPITVPAGQASANAGNNQQQEERQQQAESEKQLKARDKYVDQLRGGVREQAEELLGGKGREGGIRGSGSYSTVAYLPRQATPTGETANEAGSPLANGAVPSKSNKKPIFKAGRAIFATLDAEVNTDDGGDVLATVRGGPYDGSKLIGKIEQAPHNIRLRFSILSPQDDRPTLAINAVAIRQEDAKQGIAETIDNHTISRYAALFAGSILSGIGKAAMQTQGTTAILPTGQLVMSQPAIDNKRIGMFALGEIGINSGSEVRKKFSEPPTYITPANTGIGVVFMADVNEK